MRSILAALAFSILPSAAFAECGCVCAGGQAVGVCSLAYETPPICQRLCTPSLARTIATPGVSTTINPGSVYGSSNLARNNPAAAAAAAAAAATLGGGAVAPAPSPTGAMPSGVYGVSPGGSMAQPF